MTHDDHHFGDDDGMSTSQHMIAGAAAGLFEHAIVFPIDTVKTRMQSALSSPALARAGVFSTFSTIIAEEGVMSLFRGLSAVALSAAPAHAFYFAAYEAARERLMALEERISASPDASTTTRQGAHFLASMGAGVVATAAHDAVSTPLDVAKQRMQLGAVPYRSLWHCITTVARTQGLHAFWVSYPTTLVLNIPFTSAYFATYETIKNILQPHARDHHQQEVVFQGWKHILAGSGAGAVAAAVSNPLDVVKTRLQTQEAVTVAAADVVLSDASATNPPHHKPGVVYRGFMDVARNIVARDGWRGFMRGAGARVLFFAPSAAISWTTYEWVKFMLGNGAGEKKDEE